MMSTATSPSDKRAWLVLLAGLGAVFAWLLYRNLGLHPAIFADEWFYSKMSRLQPLNEAIVPSYLYLWLFRATTACGDGFLDCVRIGNAILFVGAGPFIYLIGRKVARPGPAIAVTLLCLLAPINLYTAFFMPEATYYFGFIVLSWVMLTCATWGWMRMALASGAVVGMMSLVKVHALFLLPALCLYFVCAAWMREPGGRWLRHGVAAALLMLATALGVKFGLGYLLAGDPALSLFGSFYSVTADSTTKRSVLYLAFPAFVNGRGHLMVLAVLLPLPMAMLALALISRRARQQAGTELNLLCLYTFLMLGSTAGMTVAYTASIAGLGPLEVVRLHLRYYTFVFPLLLLIPAALVGARDAARPPRLAWLPAVLVGAALLAALVLLPRYSPNPIDGPEISGIHLQAWPGWVVVGSGLLVLLLWARGNRFAAPLFLFAALPFTLVLGGIETSAYLRQVIPGWPADKAGKLARSHVPKSEHKLITIAGDSVMDIMRAQFHIDDKDSGMLELAKGAPIEPYQLPVRHQWLLIIGQHALPKGLTPVVATSDYALVRLNSGFRSLGEARLSQPYGGGRLLAGAQGLSIAEPWGRWSDGKHVVLHFDRPLPKQADIIIKAQAYADNTTLPFTMRVGGQSASFRLSGSLQEVRLSFLTDGAQRSLTIDVPRPTAPRTLGQWPDDRELGIGIAEVAIGTSEPARVSAN
ncbi:ArnT family glycosyltransferase [Massilia niastensis]|uniref:ArnT family glycosyltransferase n=1 Tax=Massilia niastensis TaxID=544911 RepID=UPI000371C77C|nr:hypothetical protein [Massilia niastensis]